MFRRLDLPLDRDASARLLPWVVAVMVYLAVLAVAAALAMHRAIERWETGVESEITVQVPWPSAATAEPEEIARSETALAQVIETLRGTRGVDAVERLETGEIQRLLEPWLGSGAATAELPLPRLIAVKITPDSPPDLAALSQALEEIYPGTLVDDHQRWLSDLLGLLRSLALVAALVVVLVFAAAVALVVLVTRMGLAVHRRIIQLVHLIGAQDSYIARQFQGHVLMLGLKGGLMGLLLAVPTVILLAHLLTRTQAGILPDLTLQPLEWGLITMVPLVITLIATYSARVTVLYSLSRMP